jgi:hypothetical protein
MKKTTYADSKLDGQPSFLEESEFAPITVREEIAATLIGTEPESVVLDGFLAVVKWCLLYLPGAAAIHFTMMAFSLFFFYNGWSLELLPGTAGVFAVSVFMVMFGVGRLSDLKYLRVIGALVAAGALASILYSVSIIIIPGDFFGWFTLLTLPFTVAIGQLVKMKTDRDIPV